MSVPIANALLTVFGGSVHSEYLHPVLAPLAVGPGRRPEVDFAVVKNYPKVDCVVESKWIGKNGVSASEIIWDLLRLELVAYHESASAYFLLAGKRKHLERFFQSSSFLGKPARDGTYRRLLKLDRRANARIRVDNPPRDRLQTFQKLLSPYQSLSFSSRVTTSTPHVYPIESPMFQYQVYAWQVIAVPGTPRFRPEDHSFYKSSGNCPIDTALTV